MQMRYQAQSGGQFANSLENLLFGNRFISISSFVISMTERSTFTAFLDINSLLSPVVNQISSHEWWTNDEWGTFSARIAVKRQ